MKKVTLTLGMLTALASAQALAVDEITAVHAFPPSLIYTQSFLEFVDKVNERGEGVVAYTAASFYAGTVPERDAMVASNTNAIYARENGGIDLLNEIHQEKMGTYYLGWFDSGVSYNFYTIEEPSVDADGNLSVSGLRLRSNPVYDAFFQDYLGAQPISLPTTDVYAALERSVVNATGWTQIGLKDLNWDRFLNYRVDPAFFSTDMGVIVNLNKWDQLSEESQQILQEVAIEHERESAEKLAELAEEQRCSLT